MRPMKKVLFVCLGNICRSPMAEGILSLKARQQKLNIEVDSAGTGNWHSGESPDKRAVEVSNKYGVDISKQKARQIVLDDFVKFDLILVADQKVYEEVIALAKKNEEKQKVNFILNLISPSSNQEVPDPYFGGDEGFERVFEMLDKACDALIQNHLS